MEKRLEERIKISFPLEFDESIKIKRKIHTPASKDEIINISYGGACFVSNVKLDINQLGFESKLLEEFKSVLSQPHGIIIVTGPTGSGKSTTLYSALNYLKNPKKNKYLSNSNGRKKRS